MSYRSRLYNHRNAQSTEGNDKPFFSKKQKKADPVKKNAFFQAKLEVNKPGDKYEQEADAVAAKVVKNTTAATKGNAVQRLSTEDESKMPATNDGRMAEDKRIQEKPMIKKAGAPEKEKEKPVVQKMGADHEKEKKKDIQKMELPEKKKEEGMPAAVQKMGASEKEKEKPVVQKMSADPEKEKMKGIQKMELPEKKKEEGMPAAIQKMGAPLKEEKEKATAVQRKSEAGANTASPKVAATIEGKSGKGNKLPQATLQEMNASFGKDFSNVNIHKDAEAANLNHELQAQAFTHGRDIYFNEGKFDPATTEGKFLLAHELTHVVQQNEGIYRDEEAASDDSTSVDEQQAVATETGASVPATAPAAAEGEIIGGWVVYANTAKKGGSWPWALNNPGSLTVGPNHINDGGMFGDYKRTKGLLRIFPSWQMGFDAIETYLKGWTGATLKSIAFLPYGERGRENEYLQIFISATNRTADTKISDLTVSELAAMVRAIVNQEGGNTAGQELPRSTPAAPPQLPAGVFGK